MPETSMKKMAIYPYCVIQWRICCSIGGFSSDHQTTDIHRRALAVNHRDAAFGDVIARFVGRAVVADLAIGRYLHVLIEDGAAEFGAAPDVAVIHDDAIF